VCRTAILKATTKRTKRESKNAEEHNSDHHRDHPGNIFSRSSDYQPCGWKRQNDSEQVNQPGVYETDFTRVPSNYDSAGFYREIPIRRVPARWLCARVCPSLPTRL
jgi:hypothetical protein